MVNPGTGHPHNLSMVRQRRVPTCLSNRMNVLRLLLFCLALSPALSLAQASRAEPVQTPHLEAELIAEAQQLVPGGDNWVALRLKPEAGWHVYWRNPGDSGLPTELQWQLPEGVQAGEIHWPYPHRESLGDLTNYGYGEQTLFLVPLSVSATSGTELTLKATAKWLVCKDVCIPGEAPLSLTLPVSEGLAQPDPRWMDVLAAARAQLPQPAPAQWQPRFTADSTELRLALTGISLAEGAELAFFPYLGELVSHSAEQRLIRDADGLRLAQAASPYFTSAPQQMAGVLVISTAGTPAQAWEIQARSGDVPPVPASGAPRSQAVGATALPLMLLLALAGGLVLNLMPCVFPVLSLKAVSVMQAQGEDLARHRAHALAYTAGAVLSFMAVAGVLLALRAGGSAVGWGFQLQSPVFVAALVYLIFALGLSLSGVVSFGGSWMGAGQRLTERPGLSGSFFTGVLAVVVASPCTAPFMGTALGFALTQNAVVALPVFAALGLGMALPFLLLGLFPRLAGLLPRPGRWMDSFKQVLAFPMYLTAVWLLWVLGGLTDRNGMALALLGLVLLSFALWLAAYTGRINLLLRVAALAGAAALLAHPLLRAPRPAQAAIDSQWQPYSDARFAALRAAGRTVFVDFTADWCLTCKVNESVALGNARVQAAFASQDVALLMGDWTRADPEITAVLQRYGRSGVPLYLLSRGGAEPDVLPQILTPDLVIKALDTP